MAENNEEVKSEGVTRRGFFPRAAKSIAGAMTVTGVGGAVAGYMLRGCMQPQAQIISPRISYAPPQFHDGGKTCELHINLIGTRPTADYSADAVVINSDSVQFGDRKAGIRRSVEFGEADTVLLHIYNERDSFVDQVVRVDSSSERKAKIIIVMHGTSNPDLAAKNTFTWKSDHLSVYSANRNKEALRDVSLHSERGRVTIDVHDLTPEQQQKAQSSKHNYYTEEKPGILNYVTEFGDGVTAERHGREQNMRFEITEPFTKMQSAPSFPRRASGGLER